MLLSRRSMLSFVVNPEMFQKKHVCHDKQQISVLNNKLQIYTKHEVVFHNARMIYGSILLNNNNNNVKEYLNNLRQINEDDKLYNTLYNDIIEDLKFFKMFEECLEI